MQDCLGHVPSMVPSTRGLIERPSEVRDAEETRGHHRIPTALVRQQNM